MKYASKAPQISKMTIDELQNIVNLAKQTSRFSYVSEHKMKLLNDQFIFIDELLDLGLLN